MQSTLTPQDTDPHDAFVIEPDVVLAARQASPDPVQELLSHLAHKAAQASPEVSVVPQVSIPEVSAVAPPPVVDTTFRAATIDAIDTKDRPVLPDDRHGFGWWLRRASVAFMFALCSAFAAAAWTHHGAAAKQMISSWLPPFVLAASPLAEKPVADKPAEQPDPAPVQAAADPAPAQPAAPAQAATPTPAQSSDTAPATLAAAPAQPAPSTPSPSTPLPSTPSPPTARDLAAMGQQIEQLKASIEQLKAGQAQMAREIAKNSEPSARPRASTVSPRPVAAIPPRPIPARKPPRQAYLPPPVITSAQPSYAMPPPPPQPAMSQPMASQQVLPLPEATVPSDDGPVIRPPMPLR
jgi:hypothetical protein